LQQPVPGLPSGPSGQIATKQGVTLEINMAAGSGRAVVRLILWNKPDGIRMKLFHIFTGETGIPVNIGIWEALWQLKIQQLNFTSIQWSGPVAASKPL